MTSEADEVAKAVKSKRKRDKRLRERKNTKNLELLAGALTTLVKFEEAEINRKAREKSHPLISGAHVVANLVQSKYELNQNAALEGLEMISQLRLLLRAAEDTLTDIVINKEVND